MPATHEIWLKTDLKRPITVQTLHGLLFSADNQGDKVGFEVYADGAPVTLSGVITGYIIKANGETVIVSGSFDGNKAWIVCPANAYDAVGPIYIAIKNRASTASTAVATTLGMCTTYVQRTTTGEIVTPTYKIIDVATIATMIDDAEAATAAANTAASTANTAAQKLDDIDAAASTLAPESAATANVTTVDGHYRINLGIPKGDTGDDAAITSVTTSYATNGSASTVPADSAFGPTPPAVPQGNYLWTKTTLTWNNGQKTVLNLPSRQGQDGSGSVSSVNDVSPDNNGNVALPIDNAPTANSDNPVKSSALKTLKDGYDADIAGLASDIADLTADMGAAKATVGIVEDGDTATHNISAGQRVVWKGALYVASEAINIDTTLSTANLTAAPNGLGNQVAPVALGGTGATTLDAACKAITNGKRIKYSSHVTGTTVNVDVTDFVSQYQAFGFLVCTRAWLGISDGASIYYCHGIQNGAYKGVLRVAGTTNYPPVVEFKDNHTITIGYRDGNGGGYAIIPLFA